MSSSKGGGAKDKDQGSVVTSFQNIPPDMYPRPPKLAVFERPAWLEFCRIWVAYAEDCADVNVKVARVCKAFEGPVAVSVRSTLGLGSCDDLSPAWRQVEWDAVKSKVDAHFKQSASADDLRPVYSKVLVLDSYDSFRTMHVALTVFESALAKKDAELGSDALPIKTKRDIVKKALELSPFCKFWLENLTFESASEISVFLLANVAECVAFERKFGHAPGCKTNPVYKKGVETKIHSIQEEISAAVQKAMSKLPLQAPVVSVAAIGVTPRPTSKWPIHSGPTGCGRPHKQEKPGDCWFVGNCKDGKITCDKEQRDQIMRSHLGDRPTSGASSTTSAEPSPPAPDPGAGSKKKRRGRSASPTPPPPEQLPRQTRINLIFTRARRALLAAARAWWLKEQRISASCSTRAH